MNLFRRKSIEELRKDSTEKSKLKRALGAFDLTMLGIGAVIGTGIFVLTGTAALKAGPALVLSFILAGLACAFTALSYAEFAALVPVSGSVYTYSYATLGEFVAWIIGWDLVLEYLFAVSTVSAGWSGYFQKLLAGFGIHLPVALTAAPGTKEGVTTFMDLPALMIVLFITFLLSRGITASKRLNNLMVVIKLGVVLLFIAVGIFYVKPANWTPFMPFGWSGVALAAASVFFAYVGFDAVASAAEETKNPQKDLPKGLLWSLGICTLLYVVVAAIMTGIVHYEGYKGINYPVAKALEVAGQDWVAGFISLGAILGMTTVLLVMLYGQTRIFYAMSRDGLLPQVFSKVHEKYRTPFTSTWLLGSIAGVIGAFVPLENLSELVNIGTLFAFMLVSLGVIILRYRAPEMHRPFRCPGVPIVPGLAILFCLFLMSFLQAITWIAFLVWFLIGQVVYFAYARRNSLLSKQQG